MHIIYNIILDVIDLLISLLYIILSVRVTTLAQLCSRVPPQSA